MDCWITVLPEGRKLRVARGTNLLSALRDGGFPVEAPCGGEGRCGKCRVTVNGREVVACQRSVDGDLTVTLPQTGRENILTAGITAAQSQNTAREGYLLAFDIGTTTVAGYLLEGITGRELACASAPNPQRAFGADVITRIRHALAGQMEAITGSIRVCVNGLSAELCRQAGIAPEMVSTVSIVGNPAMQQLFLGIRPENLVKIPFNPVLTRGETVAAAEYLPVCASAQMLIVPDISGYVGADTVACVLATGMDRKEEMTLLVDIGTNGEMVLGNAQRMAACATAAGPALEGANIRFGMRAQEGAIDHVYAVDGGFRCSVIGGGEAESICGSGLIDAVAAALELGLLNQRGNILNPEKKLRLTDSVWLEQEDIRQVQLAKGAIAAGIEQLAAYLGITLEQIGRVCLAGAFGTFMNPEAACRMGLLPEQLAGKILPVGNAAGSGAKMLACEESLLAYTEELTGKIEFVELAAAPGFQRRFAKHMRFTL